MLKLKHDTLAADDLLQRKHVLDAAVLQLARRHGRLVQDHVCAGRELQQPMLEDVKLIVLLRNLYT